MNSLAERNSSGRSYRMVHPHRLMLWLYLGSTVMIFAGLTSAVIVSYGDWANKPTGWALRYDLPPAFLWTTIVVIASSITMQFAFWSARRNRTTGVVVGLLATLGLGIVFLFGQIVGFRQLIQDGVYLIISTNPSIPKGNPSGSFLFVIAFLHGLHLVAAVFICITFTIKALLRRINPERLLGFELAVTFWHALGILWVYLFLFLSYLYN